NPASDKVYIEAEQMIESVTIKLINLEGQVLWEEAHSVTETGLRAVVQVGFLNSGIYLIRIDGKELNYETKIVIIK
ncbi:MAG: T9SS type A sorting domain-containing protein, partial [Bacteroidales bacterium]|nr:T9SS type A sorting domain-containing protein [Bacteroidales bacterium]